MVLHVSKNKKKHKECELNHYLIIAKRKIKVVFLEFIYSVMQRLLECLENSYRKIGLTFYIPEDIGCYTCSHPFHR